MTETDPRAVDLPFWPSRFRLIILWLIHRIRICCCCWLRRRMNITLSLLLTSTFFSHFECDSARVCSEIFSDDDLGENRQCEERVNHRDCAIFSIRLLKYEKYVVTGWVTRGFDDLIFTNFHIIAFGIQSAPHPFPKSYIYAHSPWSIYDNYTNGME